MQPHVTCIMPTTAKRLWCIPRSIRCWLRQTWKNRELLIVSEGEDYEGIERAVCEGAGVTHYTGLDRLGISHQHWNEPHAPYKTLGEKYDHSISLAEGPYIAFWADDDWNHPERLEFVMQGITKLGVRIAGSRTMTCYRVRDKTTWLYMSDPQLPHLISGTMIFHKDVWRKHPWPHVQSGSDTTWVFSLLWPKVESEEEGEQHGGEEYALTDDPRIYCAFVHDDCTGNMLDRGRENRPVWDKLEGYDLRRLIREDQEAFGLEP